MSTQLADTELTAESTINDPFESPDGFDTTQEATIVSELTTEQSNAAHPVNSQKNIENARRMPDER